MNMFKACQTDFNLDRHLVSFLQDSPFFAELSRHITKIPTEDMPTAAVVFDQKRDDIVLYWNPQFFASLSPREIRGVLIHEFYHLVFGHLYGRKRTPPQLWNIATDLAINSIILDPNRGGNSHLEGDRLLPDFALVPGRELKHPEGREWTEAEKASQKLSQIIAELPPMQASEWYFEKIYEKTKDDPDFASAMDSIGSLDDHGGWDQLPDEIKEYVEGKVKSIVEKAVKTADSQANGWGSIPSDLVDSIRKSVANVINWRKVLRQFVGQLVRGGRTNTMKRINKRYPYIHPGTKRGYEAKLLIAIDQSGSVHNEMLAEFFAELGSLTKKVTIDVLPFDCEADVRDVYEWRRGANVQPQRIRAGGTDFNAPTVVVNDPKNRGRWDGMLILTDGECSAPGPSRVKRGWVLGRGCKLHFNTSELTISMQDGAETKGAWR